MLSRIVFNSVREMQANLDDGKSDSEEFFQQGSVEHITVNVSRDDSMKKAMQIDAKTDHELEDEVTLTFNITYNGKLFDDKKNIEKLQQLISYVSRHELEHVGQKDIRRDYKDDIQSFSDPVDMLFYLTNKHEIEAFVSEIYYAAKKRREPLERALVNRLKMFGRILLRNGADQQDTLTLLFHVKNKWLAYASKRFPAAFTSPHR